MSSTPRRGPMQGSCAWRIRREGLKSKGKALSSKKISQLCEEPMQQFSVNSSGTISEAPLPSVPSSWGKSFSDGAWGGWFWDLKLMKDFAVWNQCEQTDSETRTSGKDKCSKIESRISLGISAHFDDVKLHLFLLKQAITRAFAVYREFLF